MKKFENAFFGFRTFDLDVVWDRLLYAKTSKRTVLKGFNFQAPYDHIFRSEVTLALWRLYRLFLAKIRILATFFSNIENRVRGWSGGHISVRNWKRTSQMTFQPIIMIGFSTKNFGFFGSDQLFLKDFLTRIFSLFSLREMWPKPKMIFFKKLKSISRMVIWPYKKNFVD